MYTVCLSVCLRAVASRQSEMGEMDEALQEFASTGRAGRRNALPDIRGEHASTSTADLPGQLEKMSCSGERPPPSRRGPLLGVLYRTALFCTVPYRNLYYPSADGVLLSAVNRH